MQKYIDLHFHSIHSEGDYDVGTLLKMGRQNRIEAMALTDHNTINGVPELFELAPKFNIKALAGVEIYTHYQDKKLHLLGYNFNLGNNLLAKKLNELQLDNAEKAKQSIKNLQAEGFIIDEHAFFSGPSSSYGIVHILKEIENHEENVKKINKELQPRHNDFFCKIGQYFSPGKPGHMPLSELPTPEAIGIIKQCGGIAILAHPGQQLRYDGDPIIEALIKQGLDGIEMLSPYHTWHQIEHYQNFALEHKLIVTGGSDFHGDIDFTKKEFIARQWDYYKIPYSIYQALKIRLNNN